MTSNHVLIVGVDEYDDTPDARLRGARNDAVSWWRLCIRHLGVPAEQVTVLASPPLSPEELGDDPRSRLAAERTELGGATHHEIMAAFERLARTLAERPNASALFTFAGHGLATGPVVDGVTGTNLALCPQDVVVGDGSDEKMIEVLRLEECLEELSCARMTMVLDACYSTGRRRHPRGRSLAPEGIPPETASRLGLRSRLILASQVWSPAYELVIDGRWHGACSWVLTRLLERWQRRQLGETRFINVSYHDLVFHAANALDVFGVDQVPVMWGERRLDNLAFAFGGGVMAPGTTSRRPDRRRRGRQIPVNPNRVLIYGVAVDEQLLFLAIAAGDPDQGTRPAEATFAIGGEDVVVSQGEEVWIPTMGNAALDGKASLEVLLRSTAWGDEAIATTIMNHAATLNADGALVAPIDIDAADWAAGSVSGPCYCTDRGPNGSSFGLSLRLDAAGTIQGLELCMSHHDVEAHEGMIFGGSFYEGGPVELPPVSGLPAGWELFDGYLNISTRARTSA